MLAEPPPASQPSPTMCTHVGTSCVHWSHSRLAVSCSPLQPPTVPPPPRLLLRRIWAKVHPKAMVLASMLQSKAKHARACPSAAAAVEPGSTPQPLPCKVQLAPYHARSGGSPTHTTLAGSNPLLWDHLLCTATFPAAAALAAHGCAAGTRTLLGMPRFTPARHKHTQTPCKLLALACLHGPSPNRLATLLTMAGVHLRVPPHIHP